MALNLIYLIVIKCCTPQAYSNRLLEYQAIAPDRTGVTKSGLLWWIWCNFPSEGNFGSAEACKGLIFISLGQVFLKPTFVVCTQYVIRSSRTFLSCCCSFVFCLLLLSDIRAAYGAGAKPSGQSISWTGHQTSTVHTYHSVIHSYIGAI